MSRLPLALLALAATGCASTPPPAPATRAATPVCVVSMDGDAGACPEAAEPIPESDEPCVERRAEGFNHGPMARVHAFCTPAESARRAAKALGKDEQD